MLFQSQSILLVDHPGAHVGIIREVLEQQRVANAVHQVECGSEAREFLEGAGKYSDRTAYQIPGLILLDLRVKGAFEFLAWLSAHPEFKRLPVVVLTESNDPENIRKVYSMGARSYLVKPFDQDKFRELVKAINAYWVILVQKPTFH